MALSMSDILRTGSLLSKESAQLGLGNLQNGLYSTSNPFGQLNQADLWRDIDRIIAANPQGLTQTKTVATLTAEEVDSSAKAVDPEALPEEAYLQLAAELGLDSPAIEEAKLLKVLHEEAVGIFNYEKVDTYLQQMAQKQGARTYWVWKPLRSKDRDKFSGPLGGGAVRYSPKVYQHAVPLPILMTIKKIADKMPEAVFFCSDYEVQRPDPFIGVSTQALFIEGKIWVIERFNEPGFRE